jgi:16S rRNA (guanine527-N7)-methyltransferase
LDFKDRLRHEAEMTGISLTDEMLMQFYLYKEILQDCNQRINLTSLDTDNDILYKHFLDSLTVARYIKNHTARCIDVGTGAGFPLMPVKIALPGLRVTLLDSVNKKVDFLRMLTVKLGGEETECIASRAEDLARAEGYRDGYDHVFSRAVAPLNVLLEYCIPFLKTGGTMLAMKSSISDEVEDARDALRELGAECSAVNEFYMLYEGESYKRTIAEIVKIKPTNQKYPRKAGMARKNPL